MLKPDLPHFKPEPRWENKWIGYLQPRIITLLRCAISLKGPF